MSNPGKIHRDNRVRKAERETSTAINGFHPVIDIGDSWDVLDLSKGYDPQAISLDPPSIGRYNERRTSMYTTGLFGGVRNIHMGLDIWVPEETPIRAFADGKVLFFRDNDNPGDYGPTIITEHEIGPEHTLYSRCTQAPARNSGHGEDIGQNEPEKIVLYALFGHLTRTSLGKVAEGMHLKRGDVFAEVGGPHENGGWVPHLHFQLSWERPSEPDMPGVVAPEDHERALRTYPDPRLVLGNLY